MISLEALSPGRFELVARWLSNPEINRWLTSEWRGRATTATAIAIVLRNPRNRLFVILYGDQPCGLVALADIDTSDKTAMVWYFLGEPTLARKGITSEAVRQLARFAFREMGLNALYAWVMEDNNRSERVLLKAGFAPAGRIRSATRSGERQVNRVYFDLVSDL
jgi:RimJ/RimL family protein N-acetyltransferase